MEVVELGIDLRAQVNVPVLAHLAYINNWCSCVRLVPCNILSLTCCLMKDSVFEVRRSEGSVTLRKLRVIAVSYTHLTLPTNREV